MPVCNIIMPLPNHDFDPTEVAVSWQILRAAGHEVIFATPDGQMGAADTMMLSGEGLDPWGWLPIVKKIRLFGLMLRADRLGRAAYAALKTDAQFQKPQRYSDLQVADYDALFLPGGHAQGMKRYLESPVLQNFVADFFETGKPVAAICHGVVLAARAISRRTGRSVLHGRKTTALTWRLENSAWQMSKWLLRFWDANYYRTYTENPGEIPGQRSVEMEVRRALANAADFLDVPPEDPHYLRKTCGIVRDRPHDARAAWVVQDGNYLSARWPGDVHTLGHRLVALLAESMDVIVSDETGEKRVQPR